MDNLREKIAERKTLSIIIVLGSIVFMTCFSFPVYNWGKVWPLGITLLNLIMPFLYCGYVGAGLALIFPQKGYFSVFALLIVFIGIGMVCRFLLEFGEVSNTYNFTMPNILFHMMVVVILTSLSWLHGKKFC